jgi:hypothetical protein
MSRLSMKEWTARLTPEEVDQIIKQVIREFKTEEGNAEIIKILKDKKPVRENEEEERPP